MTLQRREEEIERGVGQKKKADSETLNNTGVGSAIIYLTNQQT